MAAYAAGWIPWVGWIAAAQINIFYDALIEPIAKAITYNIAYWIGGSKSFLQAPQRRHPRLRQRRHRLPERRDRLGLGPAAAASVPLPRRSRTCRGSGFCRRRLRASRRRTPWRLRSASRTSQVISSTPIYYPVRNTIDYGVSVFQDVLAPIPVVRIVGDQTELLWDNLVLPISDSVVLGAIDPILNAPLNINSYINGAYNVGATTVNSLINTGFAEANYFLGGVPFAASTQESQLNKTAEVSAVPSIVKNALMAARTVGDDETARPRRPTVRQPTVRETVRNVRNEIREATGRTAIKTTNAGDDARRRRQRGGPRSERRSRRPLTKASSDVTSALRRRQAEQVGAEVANEPRRSGRASSDTARNVVKKVRAGGEGRTRRGQEPTRRRCRRVSASASRCAGRAAAPAAARPQRSTAAVAIAR